MNEMFAVKGTLSADNVGATFKIDLDKHVQKVENKFRYLAWPVAHEAALKLDPGFAWRPVYFENVVPGAVGPGGCSVFKEYPYQFFHDGTVMVTVGVTLYGVERFEQLPVMDHKNNSVVNPTSRDISDTTKRAVVKCLASAFGLGLEVFKKEGLADIQAPEGNVVTGTSTSVSGAAPAANGTLGGGTAPAAQPTAVTGQAAPSAQFPEFEAIDKEPEFQKLADIKQRPVKNFLTGSAAQYVGFIGHIDRELANNAVSKELGDKIKAQALTYTTRKNPAALPAPAKAA